MDMDNLALVCACLCDRERERERKILCKVMNRMALNKGI